MRHGGSCCWSWLARGSEVAAARGGWSAPRTRWAGHGWLVEDGARAWRPMARVGGDARVVELNMVCQVGGSVTWRLRGGRGEVAPPWARWVSRTADLAGADAAVELRGHRACSWCWSAVIAVYTKRCSLHRSSLVRGATDVGACIVGRLVDSCETTVATARRRCASQRRYQGGRGLHR
jgi:hypothetical protein